MKTIIALLAILLSTSVYALPTKQLKADWINRNDVASDTPITVEPFKNKSGKAVGAYVYSSWDCGSQGCTYTLYAPVDGGWCSVGTYMGIIDNLANLINPSCGDGFLDDSGIKEGVLDTPSGGMPEFTVDLTYMYLFNLPIKVVAVESLENSLVVENVAVNRGSCTVIKGRTAGRKLGYAEVSNWQYDCGESQPREIVVTIRGVEYTFRPTE